MSASRTAKSSSSKASAASKASAPAKALAPAAQPKRLTLATFVQNMVSTTEGSQNRLRDDLFRGQSLLLFEGELPRRLLIEASLARWNGRPAECASLETLAAAVDELASPPLFGEPLPLLVRLPAKLSKSQWALVAEQCQRLAASDPESGGAPSSLPPVWFLGNPGLRKSVTAVEGLEMFLGYSPTRSECQQIMTALYGRCDELRTRPRAQQLDEISKALVIYEADFVLADDHFRRMNETGLAFDDVFVDVPLMDVYHLIEALPIEPLPQVLLRLDQCQRNGEEPARVLSAVSGFLRQFVRFCGLARAGTPESQIFQTLGIPFPAQAKFSAARKHLSPDKALRFLARAPDLELKIRQTYRGPDLLAVELTQLFQ